MGMKLMVSRVTPQCRWAIPCETTTVLSVFSRAQAAAEDEGLIWSPEQGHHGGSRGLVRESAAPQAWHDGGMSRTRLSTTVDAGLLESARKASGKPDSALVDEALAALLARHRSAEVDASYAAYDAHPLDEPDEWGDLASFRRAVAAS